MNKIASDLPGRPLVTFALLAYNQEQYIREAVEGAFAQTYEPLEIILSDDGSSDSTFDLIRSAAAQYDGPHRVITRRSKENRGLIQHVRAIANESKGLIIVLAAGDDVSKPERTSRLIRAYLDGADAVCSSYDLIDEDGRIIRKNQQPLGNAQDRMPWFEKVYSPTFIYGSTSSYRTELLRALPNTNERVMSEDTPLNTLIQVRQKDARWIDESLVLYRQHAGTISRSIAASGGFTSFRDEDILDQKRAQMNANILRYIRDNILSDGSSEITFSDDYFTNELEFLEIKGSWRKMNFFERGCILLQSKDRRRARWCALRLLGSTQFALLKSTLAQFRRSTPLTK